MIVVSVSVVSTLTFCAVGPLGLEVRSAVGACATESVVSSGGEVDGGALE